MGLDNGIEIKRNEKANSIYNLIARFERDWYKDSRFDFELAYFRKCWNVRSLIADGIGGIEDNGTTDLTRDDVQKIIEVLKSLNEKNWDEDHSIWTWEEQKPYIKRYIENLEYVYELIGTYDLDVYFYDSY
jgi:hypothetical protein